MAYGSQPLRPPVNNTRKSSPRNSTVRGSAVSSAGAGSSQTVAVSFPSTPGMKIIVGPSPKPAKQGGAIKVSPS